MRTNCANATSAVSCAHCLSARAVQDRAAVRRAGMYHGGSLGWVHPLGQNTPKLWVFKPLCPQISVNTDWKNDQGDLGYIFISDFCLEFVSYGLVYCNVSFLSHTIQKPMSWRVSYLEEGKIPRLTALREQKEKKSCTFLS